MTPDPVTPTLDKLATTLRGERRLIRWLEANRRCRDILFADLAEKGVPKTGPNGIEHVVKAHLRDGLGWSEDDIAAAHVSTGTVRQGIDRVT